MTTAIKYPKVQYVRAEANKMLWVQFDNGVAKRYDCKPLLTAKPFNTLQNDALFQAAHADAGGYGVIWNDHIDLAESEIWINGMETEPCNPS